MREGPSLVPGFRFPDRAVALRAPYQGERLIASGVDPDLWGGMCEPVLWALEGFRSMTAVGQDIDGYVHVEQRLIQAVPVPLGETVTFRGETVALDPVPRGRHLVQRFEVVRADGEVALVAEHVGLLPDPTRMGGGAGRPAETAGAALEVLAEKTLTPDQVRVFSGDVGNEIHFDPEFAARYGYRAPLAQGLMTMLWMLGRLAADQGAPAAVNVVARFRRPVFWDDAMILLGRRGDDGRLGYLETRNLAGRPTAGLDIRSSR
jgi:acyl dehydratase